MGGCGEPGAEPFAIEGSSPSPLRLAELTNDNDQDNGAYHSQYYHHLQEEEREQKPRLRNALPTGHS